MNKLAISKLCQTARQLAHMQSELACGVLFFCVIDPFGGAVGANLPCDVGGESNA
jgi:hypothetical protein